MGGTITGPSDTIVDTFNGVPFAEPPVGNLRLRASQPLQQPPGNFAAVDIRKSCAQQSPINLNALNVLNLPANVTGQVTGNPMLRVVTNTSEDCLRLNVQRPAGLSSNISLPMLV